MLIQAIIEAAEASLSLLLKKEENFTVKKSLQMIEKLSTLKKDFYNEYNKDPSIRSDAILDHLQFELRNYLNDYTSFIRTQNLQDKWNLRRFRISVGDYWRL